MFTCKKKISNKIKIIVFSKICYQASPAISHGLQKEGKVKFARDSNRKLTFNLFHTTNHFLYDLKTLVF